MLQTSDITAAILVGGAGTRLREVVADRPKPLAPILGRPFLSYLLDQLADGGFRRVILCTGHMADLVPQAIANRHGPLEIGYSVETVPLGTAGALKLALGQMNSEVVLAMNGDSYCDADLKAFAAFHYARMSQASILLTRVEDSSRFGRVCVDHADQVTAFVEKGGDRGAGWINAGIYLLSRKVIEAIPQGRPVSIEREVFPSVIGKGLMGYRGGGRFIDIGTPQSYRQAEQFFASKSKPELPR